MKLYPHTWEIKMGIVLLLITIIIMGSYSKGIYQQIYIIKTGIPVEGKVINGQDAGFYTTEKRVKYIHPITKSTEVGYLDYYNKQTRLGDSVQLYYDRDTQRVVSGDIRASLENLKLFLWPLSLMVTIYLFKDLIYQCHKRRKYKKKGMKIQAKVCDILVGLYNQQTIWCEYRTEEKELVKFCRENVFTGKLRNGIALGDRVEVYIIGDNYSNYYIALEDIV